MRNLPHIVAEVFTKPWLIEARKGAVIASLIARRVAGERLAMEDEEPIAAARLEQNARLVAAARAGGGAAGLAVIPLLGVLVHRGTMDNTSGMTSTELVAAKFRAAELDPNVGTIVLDVDSPGGEVAGTMELADIVAASSKPVVAVVNSMAGSAAYWIASAADELIVTPSGEVGSIGVLIMHQDDSKSLEQEGITRTVISAGEFKAELWGPMTEEARAYLEAQAQVMYDEFVGAVAHGRGVSKAVVREKYGKGRMLLAGEALRAGMVDRVATFQQTLDRLVGGGRVKRRRAVASPTRNDLDIRRRLLDLDESQG